MLLTVDIGNTNITCGIFFLPPQYCCKEPAEKIRAPKLIKKYSFSAKDKEGITLIKKIIFENKISQAIICSVVPKKTRELKEIIRKILKKSPFVAGENIKVPIKNLYRKPKQAGQDRLVNAYGGIIKYGAPLIIIDFGTAVTFDVVSGKGEYLGGLILPGLNLSLEALAQKTALLPNVRLKQPKELIGRDTRESILSGVVYGFAGLADSLIEKIQKKIGKNAKVVATGGNCGLIARYSQKITAVDPNLILCALALMAKHRIRP